MTLQSALEDLQETTLKSISGPLRRLEYMAHLRDRTGDYSHWGLNRVYGRESAAKALTQAHRAVVSQVLSTPLRNLVGDAEEAAGTAGSDGREFLEKLAVEGKQLLPVAPEAGSERHLTSVLHALSSLLKNRTPDASRRV
jgi:hypothetical protein